MFGFSGLIRDNSRAKKPQGLPASLAISSHCSRDQFEMRSFERLVPIWVNTVLIWPDDVTV
jgi:hypothetical protein